MLIHCCLWCKLFKNILLRQSTKFFVQDISEEVLGRMVVEAVEEAFDPVADEVAVFRFLVLLYNSTKEYEKHTADLMLEKALKASEEGHFVDVS